MRRGSDALPAEADTERSTPEALGSFDADAWLTACIETINANLPPNLDPDALASLYAEDCLNIQPLRELPGGPLRGRDAMRRFFASFDAHWADWTHVEVSRMTKDNRAVWETVAQGVHKKTGRFVKMPIVFFFEFDQDGKIKEERVYVDNGLVEEQIR